MSFSRDAKKGPEIALSRDTVYMDYNGGISDLSVLSNCTYNITNENEWLTSVQNSKDNVSVFGSYNFRGEPRTGKIIFTSVDGTCVREFFVKQGANNINVADYIKEDTRLKATGTASQSQGGEGIERTYDNDFSTLYHSPYSGTKLPVTLTYTLSDVSHLDYLVYTPRQDGNTNGNFTTVTVEYTLSSAPDSWISLASRDFGGSGSATRINFGDSGIDNVKKIRIKASGMGGWASCAEMGFYQKDREMSEVISKYFSDNICSSLKEGVNEKTAGAITQPYIKHLVYNMLDGSYSVKYRIREFKPYRHYDDLSAELKTATYNRYENPTGIYFAKGDKLIIFAEGIGSDPVSLIIKSFGKESYSGEGHPESSYPLVNGVNIIGTANRGNGYIAYFTDNYTAASKVKIHFAMAKENGYFDMERGDTDDDWKSLLAGACSDIIDVRTKRMQVACPLYQLQAKCPSRGRDLVQIYDNVIYREREVMGLIKFNREPENRQFARPVDSGMFADGIGAAADFGSFAEWVNPSGFGYWGFAHELGHVNQVRPGLKWVGCGETTNNIYSAWVEFSLGDGYLRLEDENSGVNDYNGIRGGRFNTYLEEGVRKGVYWQLQDGPDYHGSSPETVTVNDEDYEGNIVGKITTTKRNYDHFVKVVPLWQLLLYTQQAGKCPDVYGKVIEGIRNYSGENSMSNGQLQIKFMRSFCDSAKVNFLPFFEKAGMLKPINSYIEDYSPGWLKISDGMIQDLKRYIEAKGYPEADRAVNYISGYNWQIFRDSAPLTEAILNSGCSKLGNGRIQVDNTVWKNAVAYETYDSAGNLLRISMFGLGAPQKSNRYTQVLWPNTSSEKAAYIMAVGFDGKRVKCYQP